MHQNRSPATYSITWYRAETLNGITERLSGGPKSTFLLVGHISLHVTSFLIYREIILGEYYELLVTSLPQRRGRIYQPAQYQSKGINPLSIWHSLELCSTSLRAESWSWFILSSWYIFIQPGRTASSGANQDLANLSPAGRANWIKVDYRCLGKCQKVITITCKIRTTRI